MIDREQTGVELRARYEHFKSRPRKRKTYTTLGFRAAEESVQVLYIADYDPDRIHSRRVDEFIELTEIDGEKVPRFTLIDRDVITGYERDRLIDELDED